MKKRPVFSKYPSLGLANQGRARRPVPRAEWLVAGELLIEDGEGYKLKTGFHISAEVLEGKDATAFVAHYVSAMAWRFLREIAQPSGARIEQQLNAALVKDAAGLYKSPHLSWDEAPAIKSLSCSFRSNLGVPIFMWSGPPLPEVRQDLIPGFHYS